MTEDQAAPEDQATTEGGVPSGSSAAENPQTSDDTAATAATSDADPTAGAEASVDTATPTNNKSGESLAASASQTSPDAVATPSTVTDDASADAADSATDFGADTVTATSPIASTETLSAPTTSVTTESLEPAATAPAPSTQTDATDRVTAEVMSMVGVSPNADTGPDAPAEPESPAMWAAMAVARRELGGTEPEMTLAATETGQTLEQPDALGVAAATPANIPPQSTGVTQSAPDPATGAVAGALNAFDPDGDAITYSVATAPVGGQLTLNPNGTFTYTPSQLARINAGSTLPDDFDSFTVDVSDGTATTSLPVSVEIYSGTMSVNQSTLAVGAGPSSIALSPDGTRLYSTNQAANSVSVVSTTNGATLTIPVGAAPTQLALSKDGARLYVANSKGGSVSVIDTATGGTATIAMPSGAQPQGLAVNSTTNRLYVSVPAANRVGVFDATTGALVTTIAVGSLPVGVAVNDAGTRVYVANRGTTGNGTVSTIDAATNRVIGTTTVGSLPQQLTLSKDGTRLYVANTGSGNVSVLDTSSATTPTNVATIAVGPSPNGVTLSPDGKIAYVANGDNTVSLINTATNTKVTGTVRAPTGGLGTIAVSPDGNTVYVANSVGNTVSTVSLIHLSDPPPVTGNPGTGPLVEDFTGPAGSIADPALWNYAFGTGGSGALHFNTTGPNNAALDGNGNLVITAKQQTITLPDGSTRDYTSAFLDTNDKFEFTYGTLSARMKVPVGQGLHPTFFLVGSDIEDVGWPNSGEIDIFELANDAAHSGSAIHGPGAYNVNTQGPAFAADGQFHTYWVKWEPNKITTGVDNTTIAVFTPDSLPPGTPWTFNDRSMHAIFSLGVGGDNVGPPNASTQFPSSTVVDWMKYEPLGTTSVV